MAVTHRRPSLLQCALPQPSLTTAPTSPQTPRKSRTSTIFHPFNGLRSPSIAVPRTSSDSWNSVVSDESAEVIDWIPEQLTILSRALDNLHSPLMTPFNGPVPPSNLIDKLARNVIDPRHNPDWTHSLRATRAKLYELARNRAGPSHASLFLDSPATLQARESPRTGMRTRSASRRDLPLYRKNSMDFIPEADENNNLTKLSSRLQRTDRLLPRETGFHPYSRPTSRRAASPDLENRPSTPVRTRLTRSSANSLRGVAAPVQIRPRRFSRRASASCILAPSVTTGGLQPASLPKRSSQPSLNRLRRADSFNLAVPSLKRAPSFGGSSICSTRTLISTKEDEGEISAGTSTAVSSASEDEGEKVKKSKRNKRMKVTHEPEKENEKVKEKNPKGRKRSPSFLGEELPPAPMSAPPPIFILATQPQPQRVMTPVRRTKVPTSPATPMTPKSARSSPASSPSTPGSPVSGRTLRRIGVKVFPSRLHLLASEGQPMLGRKISFGDMQSAPADQNNRRERRNGHENAGSSTNASDSRMMLDSPFDEAKSFHLRGRI